jgi:hypothetical protein
MDPKLLASVLSPLKIKYSRIVKRQLTVLQKNEFKICQPATREKSEWFGFKKKLLLIHLKEDGKWNIKVM